MNLPKVSIVIPTYRSNSKNYLDLCISAIENLDYPKELLDIVIVSPSTYVPKYSIARNIHHPNDERNFAEAVNFGIQNSDQASKHIFLLSDDTVPTRDSLKNLVTAVADNDLIAQGLSNCDNYHRYSLILTAPINGEENRINERFFKMEFLDGNEKCLMHSASHYPMGFIIVKDICFYAALIPRKTYEKIGPLDEKFNTGYEDTDYCYRAKDLNIPVVIALNSLIWHFGGISTSELNTDEISDANKIYFLQKWHGHLPR
jgi:GT2 family glycosyltransferase